MIKILLLNGPNLNLLGKRQPEIYGHHSFDAYLSELRQKLDSVAILDYFQSNHEGALIDRLHQSETENYTGIVFNAGAYTHTSLALADAIAAIHTPVIEVHISNVFARETFRHHSFLSPVCRGTIGGLGLKGYELAVRSFLMG